MKFTLSWLQQHLETQASLDEIVEALTRVGLEVEGVENPGEKLAAFRVAKVLTAAPHPQADKLQVLTVDTGEGAFTDWRPIGLAADYTPPATGTLYLRVNDASNALADNEGTVEVRVQAAQPNDQ